MNKKFTIYVTQMKTKSEKKYSNATGIRKNEN